MASSAPSRVRGIVISALKWGIGLALLGLVCLGIAVAVATTQLPDYEQLRRRSDLGQMVRVRAADGSLLVSLGPSFGRWLSYDEIPPTMRAAMIGVEDRRFRSHLGVDPIGMARSFKVRIESGRWKQGGSTITQQLARNIFLTNSRTFGRKVKEGVLALAIEWKFSKNQILELYLNRVYFGGGAYGIDAASRTFFDHGAERLSLGEAAIIAGLVKAPSNYSPTADVEAARGRAGVVINSMVENGFLSAGSAVGVDPAEIKVQPAAKQNSVRYFTDWALPQLDTLIDESSEPIDVFTTLDPAMQAAADKAVNAFTPTGAQGALVALDRDGAVKAMIGGRNYVDSIYNRATQAERQPGSAFKLFVYLAALRAGWTPDSMIEDRPITIDGWTPANNDGVYRGAITLREAFARSSNAATVRLSESVGRPNVLRTARELGITTSLPNSPSVALGTAGVSLLELTSAYAAVASGRYPIRARGLPEKEAASRFGGLLQSGGSMDSRRDWAPMLDLLHAAANDGTGRRAALVVPTFGKTGTSQDNRDALFVGFAGNLVVGVWVGRDNDKPLGRTVSGGTVPAQIWRNFMVSAIAVDGRAGPDLPAEFRIPERVQPRKNRESPLPEEWSEGAEPLRKIISELEKLFE
jgi:penicillin-binding protein 1A